MRVEEYGRSVGVAGFRMGGLLDPKVFIEQARKAVEPALVQLFDAKTIAGPEHLLYSTVSALKAFKSGRNIAQALDMEILLYVSAQRQISEAIRKTGLNAGTSEVAAVLVADCDDAVAEAEKRLEATMCLKRDDVVLAPVGEKRGLLMSLYGVTELEFRTLSESHRGQDVLPWLIVERCALLGVRR